MRYVLGPALAQFNVPTPPPPPDGTPVDMVCSIAAQDAAGVSLTFAVPSVPVNLPAEVRVYLIAVGAPIHATADEFVADTALPVATITPTLDPAAGGTVHVPHPTVAPGDYLGQVVIGYPS